MTELFVNKSNSIEKAIAFANEIDDAVKITVAEGRYEIGKTLKIKRDNITIEGISGKTILSGSKTIDISGMHGDNNIIRINLKEHGIFDYGKFGEGPYEEFWTKYDIPKPHMSDLGPGLEVFYEDGPLSNARYPKAGFIHIEKALGRTAIESEGKRIGSQEGIFLSDDENVKKWSTEKELLLIGYWNYDWATQRHMVKRIDASTGQIEVNGPYHVYGYREYKRTGFTETGGRFYAVNVLSELNAEGEWYLDRAEGVLSVYPFRGQNYVNVSVCGDIFDICKAKNVKITNLILEQSRKSGVVMADSDNIRVENCIIKNTGAWAVIGENCRRTVVDRCLVYGTGGGGISLEGGDRNTLKSSENIISSNTVHDIARWHRTYLPALEICGVGGIVSENKVYDIPHFAIVFHGNNHIIEKNELSNTCYESNDAGAIYCGKDWSCRGNIIRYNYIHHLAGFDGKGCVGIYFDDGMSSAEVYGNILAEIKNVAVLIGGGRDFKIYNNIYYKCKIAVMIDNRVDIWENSLYERLNEQLAMVDYTSDKWKNAYPELDNFFEKEPKLPKNNRIFDNTIIGGDGLVFNDKKILNYSIIKNNTFVPAEAIKSEMNLHGWFYLRSATSSGIYA